MSDGVIELKCWPPFFGAIADGRKRFEIRRHDRPFRVGSILRLQEWDPGSKGYSGREIEVRVTYIMVNEFDLVKPGSIVMSIEPVGDVVVAPEALAQTPIILVEEIDE